MNDLNNSFPCYSSDKIYYNNIEVDPEERSNISAFHLNFLKFYEQTNENINVNIMNNNLTANNFNFSPSKKKNSLDISCSMEQTFYVENSNININIEEEFQPNEETCKIIKNKLFDRPKNW